MSRIGIYMPSTGALLWTKDSASYEPAKEPAGHATTPVPDNFPDEAKWDVPSRSFVSDLTLLEAQLIAKVKANNEALVRGVYSTNFGKQKKYSRKQQEVLDFRALSGALGVAVPNALTATLSAFLPGLSNLTAAQQKKKFRYVMAEAKLRNVGVDVVVGEIESRIDTAEDQIAAWEAVEQVTIRAIKAATTAAGKRAAYAAANWNAQPV